MGGSSDVTIFISFIYTEQLQNGALDQQLSIHLSSHTSILIGQEAASSQQGYT